MSLMPGAPHIRPEDEIFFMLEGAAQFFFDGKTKVAGPNSSPSCPSNVRHGIRNVGGAETRCLVIKK